ncbi:hypothetical protein HS1_002449 [Candidatus Desulfofervidus auxilii]|uniref:Uncharacterized protein n=1 Tax=Desulfofervidus auxilii TaxID=1621989 RepID=A0A7U4QMX4_DESA2|nr:hypothetical protein HS1_002449 [Candidatus Desulfofervidus auxilii]CAD7781432.1 hypothetical protein BLFGPEAP_02837 [Candidatus Methanoperedenaceae archaeon GB50]CAD7782335.1 hypothetical protein DMNBHIDG_03037 [Candidatus Methanoperedenaceae archaeon GB37]
MLIKNNPSSPALRFGAITLGQQAGIWLRPNPAKRDFTYPQPVSLCENPLKNNKILILFWQEKNDKREKSYHGFWVV